MQKEMRNDTHVVSNVSLRSLGLADGVLVLAHGL
jgi:hypothetical protein